MAVARRSRRGLNLAVGDTHRYPHTQFVHGQSFAEHREHLGSEGVSGPALCCACCGRLWGAASVRLCIAHFAIAAHSSQLYVFIKL